MAHHRTKNGELVEAGSIQLWLHTLYARREPWILKMLDGTLRFFSRVRGRPILWVLSRVLGRFLPTGEVISVGQATDFIDAISVLEKAEIVRLTTGQETQHVLQKCTSCFACNLICPEGCNPTQTILDNGPGSSQFKLLTLRVSIWGLRSAS